MTIRAMKPGDLDQVMEIAAGLATAPHWARSVYEEAIGDGGRRFAMVAENGSRILGFVVVAVVAPEAELESIVVAAEVQLLGAGARLLTEATAKLRMLGVDALDLEVRESNGSAIAFYLRAGFSEVGRRRGYYRDPEEDALLLRKLLNPE
jgi:ribosomal-protein-alanine N-acetyltransferase